MTSVGTLRWARRTGGRLSFFDRLALTRQAMRFRASRRDYAGKTFPPLPLEDTDLEVPDTAPAKRAVSLAATLSDPSLLNHCFRSYFCCQASTGATQIEIQFWSGTSCRRHRSCIGLSALQAALAQLESRDERRFAVTGARRAREAMQETGWSSERLDAMEEAIVLHLNVVVPSTTDQRRTCFMAASDLTWSAGDSLNCAAPGLNRFSNSTRALITETGWCCQRGCVEQCPLCDSSKIPYRISDQARV